MEWFPTGRGALALRPSQGLAPSEGCFRPPKGLAPLCKGSWQGRQALTEGLWVSCRNGLPITGDLLLYLTYNPSASHPLSTSPYTGEPSPAGDGGSRSSGEPRGLCARRRGPERAKGVCARLPLQHEHGRPEHLPIIPGVHPDGVVVHLSKAGEKGQLRRLLDLLVADLQGELLRQGAERLGQILP